MVLPLSKFVFYCCDKDHHHNQLRDESVYFILQVIDQYEEKAGQELKRGTWSQELMEKQRPWHNTTYRLAPIACSACFLLPVRGSKVPNGLDLPM